jgi:hypothetical protein
MRNNRDAVGRDGPSPCGVCYGGVEVEVGGELVIWSELLIKLAFRTGPSRPIQRLSEGFVCYLSTSRRVGREVTKRKLNPPIQRRVIYNTWLEASSTSCVQQIIDSILVIPTVVGSGRALSLLSSFAFSAPLSPPAISSSGQRAGSSKAPNNKAVIVLHC